MLLWHNRTLRKRAGNLPVRVLRPGKKRWAAATPSGCPMCWPGGPACGLGRGSRQGHRRVGAARSGNWLRGRGRLIDAMRVDPPVMPRRHLVYAALLVLVGVLAMHGAPTVIAGCHDETSAGHEGSLVGMPMKAIPASAAGYDSPPMVDRTHRLVRAETAAGHGSVCVAAPPRKAAAVALLMLILTVALGATVGAVRNAMRGPRLSGRGPPEFTPPLLLRLCVSRT
jgi:hypothetical protein